jgi:hypothetical protein
MRMDMSKIKKTSCGRVVLAQEGFVDSRYLPLLEHQNVRVIEIRMLADGPIFQSIPYRPMHA